MDSQSLIRTTQALGLTSAIFMSGIYFGSSTMAIHPLYVLPISQSTRIFTDIYHTGARVAVPLALGSTALYALSAYLVPQSRTEYGVAAAATIGTMVWTVTVMLPGIERLLKINDMDGSKVQSVHKEEVVSLLKAWRRQNYVRAGLSLLGGVLGVYAVTNSV